MKTLKNLSITEIREGAPFAVLSYVGLLWIIPFIFKPQNRFARYHARQGLIIFVYELICIFFLFFPYIGVFLYKTGWVILFAVSLYGVYASLTGKLCRIPLVTSLAQRLVV